MNFIFTHRRTRNNLLASAALGLLLANGFALAASAAGGNGGASGSVAGGIGGADGQVGGNGAASDTPRGSGGGGAGAGASGGNGGGAGGVGGGGGGSGFSAGGSASGGSGGSGGSTALNGGGGGGGGGGGNATGLTDATAGNGGSGGSAGLGANGVGGTHIGGGGGGGGAGGNAQSANGPSIGGNGGAGGDGGTFSNTLNIPSQSNTSIVQGGSGGSGGDGGVGNSLSGSATLIAPSTGGNGGVGGDGGDATSNVSSTGAGSTASATVSGGTGGTGGKGGVGLLASGSGIAVVNNSTISGGNGGTGGDAGTSVASANATSGAATASGTGGNGGSGGSGGDGVVFQGANVTFTNNSVISGGTGGGSRGAEGSQISAGGSPGTVFLSGANGGNGGSGGNGVVFVGPNSTFVNGGIVQGGDAISGAGGVDGGSSGLDGVAGAGVIGAGLTILNSGIISGGFLGAQQQFGVILTGGANAISPGGTINGGIQLQAGSLAPALPGSTIGPTLNVNGPVSFAAVSTYIIRVNGAANDSITATGAATVAGANVSATITGNALGQHTIITANQINGTFAGVSTFANSAFVTASLSYDPTHVYLNVTGNGAGGAVDFTSAAQTVNQTNVAAALNSGGAANGFTGNLINTILPMSAEQARNAFIQLDGEVGTGAQRAAFRFGDQFLNLMLNPFVDGRSAGGGSAIGYAPEAQDGLPPELAQAYASVFKAPAPPRNFEQRWTLWNAGFGGSGKTKGDPVVIGSTDTRLSTWGVAGGIDYRFSPNTVIGLAAAGGATNWGLANNLGIGRSETAQVGAYAKTQIGPAYLAETISIASHWFTTDRNALGNNLRGSFTGTSIAARIEGGYRVAVMPAVGIIPYAAAQAQAFRQGAYTETDLNNLGFGLNVAAKSATDVRTELGARFDSATVVNGLPVVLRARLAWAHDFVDTPSVNAVFQALPLSNFTVFGAAIPRDSALVSAGVDWYLARDWKLLAKFDGEFAKNSKLYAGTVAVRYSW